MAGRKPARAEIPVGKVIRQLQRQQRLSVRGLADKCGFSASFISQVELGQASPSIASTERITSALGVTLGEFFQAATPIAPAVTRRNQRPWLKARGLAPGWRRLGALRFEQPVGSVAHCTKTGRNECLATVRAIHRATGICVTGQHPVVHRE